jgi:hypothetical protein
MCVYAPWLNRFDSSSSQRVMQRLGCANAKQGFLQVWAGLCRGKMKQDGKKERKDWNRAHLERISPVPQVEVAVT